MDNISVSPVFNVATGAPVSINELANLMIKLLGIDVQPVYKDERIGDIKYAQCGHMQKYTMRWVSSQKPG